MAQHIITLKWGDRYGSEYVNRLASAVRRHTKTPVSIVCFTDDAVGIDPSVKVFPIPEIDLPAAQMVTGWRKICLFRPDPQIGNSSVFRFKLNQCGFVWDQFHHEKEWALANFRPPQSYLTHCIRPRMKFWPASWVRSFKRHCRPIFPLNLILEPIDGYGATRQTHRMTVPSRHQSPYDEGRILSFSPARKCLGWRTTDK